MHELLRNLPAYVCIGAIVSFVIYCVVQSRKEEHKQKQAATKNEKS